MTVQELIDQLKKLPAESRVNACFQDEWYFICDVRQYDKDNIEIEILL